MSAIQADIVLVGAGVMSTTLGVILKQLSPDLNILMVERLDYAAKESSDGWNNAGTGHAAYCELNYTPEQADGSVNISKALAINASFEETLQFWSFLVEQGILSEPTDFIHRTPHMSFVWGEDHVRFLRTRFEAMRQQPQFEDMEYTEDFATLQEWMPLVMQGRDATQKVAGTRVAYGSDVDFGSLTRRLVEYLKKQPNFQIKFGHEVEALSQQDNGRWRIRLEDRKSGEPLFVDAGKVFLGAGGGALPLLQKADIPEGEGYGGFPVSGQWLVCRKAEIVRQHHAKVYGKAPMGAPPMSVPHLDTRIINGKPALLFGPYAGFTTKFLKKGSIFDLTGSMQSDNFRPIMSAGLSNFDLTKYLIKEVFQSHGSRMESLRNFFPEANKNDWELAMAGQRVQIIKPCPDHGGGKLEFGTEVVAAKDGSIAALLGASPGASTAVKTMVDVIEKCFAEQLKNPAWQARMREMIPSYQRSLTEDAELLKEVRARTLKTLKLGAEYARV